MKKLLKYICKSLTYNYCDSCGLTKDDVYTTHYFTESGINQCKKCIDKKLFDSF